MALASNLHERMANITVSNGRAEDLLKITINLAQFCF